MLLERHFPGTTTCVLVGGLGGETEADFRAYKALLWFVDDETKGIRPPGIARESIHVMGTADADLREVSSAILALISRDARRLPSVFVTKDAASGNASAYKAILGQVHDSIELQHRARETRQKDGFTWQKHVLLNAPRYAQRRLPPSWEGMLKGIPAFVCGAGPSLDASCGALAAVAGQGIIFSADSALRALARRGIPADFAVSIDAAKTPEKCLAPDMPAPRVILSGVSPPAWGEAVAQDRQYFVSNRQVTLDLLAAKGLPKTNVSATESCGSTALEIARFMGCSPIYLFGMDLALDPASPSSRHNSAADATVYAASGFNFEQKYPLVPGNFGKELPTHIIGDLRALNRRLSEWPFGLVVNVNDRGARLDNATLVAPADLSVRSPAIDKHRLLDGLAKPAPVSRESLSSSLGSLRALGEAGIEAMAAPRRALEQGGPSAAAAELRRLFSQGDFGRAMGAFSLKAMPHLVMPVEGDALFWGGLLGELDELVRIAASIVF